MEEIYVTEINGKDHIVKMATWWLQAAKDIVVLLKGQDRNLLVRDHIVSVEEVAGLEDAILVTGKKWQYLLYRSDYLQTPQAMEIKRWHLASVDKNENSENEVLESIDKNNGWAWSSGQPEFTIDGNRLTDIGAAIPIHTDAIKAIVKIGDDYIAVSKRHRYLLKGEAINPAC